MLRALSLEGEAEPRHRPWASKFVLSRFPRRNLPLFFQEVRGLIRELQPADFLLLFLTVLECAQTPLILLGVTWAQLLAGKSFSVFQLLW